MEVLENMVVGEAVMQRSLTYEKYYQLIKDLLAEGKTTGVEQKAAHVKHARLNFQRMKRVYRTTLIGDELKESISSIDRKQLWLVLSEGWCGDAAQNLPAIARMAEQNENIELRILLRDENPEVMDAYLTNGSKSIPKLIAFDDESKQELFTWGPRPAFFQNMVLHQKANPKMSSEEFNEWLHREYTLDKSLKLQEEFLSLLHLSLN
jgi:hypothetical protein